MYRILLHLAVIALGAQVVLLSLQNRRLKTESRMIVEQPLSGQEFSLARLISLGGAPYKASDSEMLLLVFSTRCSYCLQNLEKWRTISSMAEQNGLLVLGISLDPMDRTLNFRQDNSIDFHTVVADDRAEFTANNHIGSVPMTVYLSKNNVVAGSWPGVLSSSAVEQIEALLADRSGPTTLRTR